MRLYGYAVLARRIDLSIQDAVADGAPAIVDEERRTVWPAGESRADEWRNLRLKCRVIVNETERDSVRDNVAVYVTLSCADTNLRTSVLMHRSDTDQLTWEGEVELDRDECRGRVALRGHVVRIDPDHERLIGSTSEWSIYADERKPLVIIDGFISVKWKGFDEDDAPTAAREHPSEPYVLDLNESIPVLYLNRSFEGLPRLFEATQRDKHFRAVKENEFVSVARSVWAALFNTSLAAAISDEEGAEVDWPAIPWQKSVLEAFLPRLYPGRRGLDALSQAVGDRSEPSGLRQMQSRLVTEIGRHVLCAATLRRTIRDLDEG